MSTEQESQNVGQPSTPPSTPKIGRNEKCPCNSGKKYKRCCGVQAEPKLSVPQAGGEASQPMFDPSALSNLDPQMMLQISQAMQRLPKGQLQRLQAIMQKAMNGKDVTAEAQEFEKTLPKDFQEMMHQFGTTQGPALLQNMQGETSSGESLALPTPEPEEIAPQSSMTEEEARALVAKAAADGLISKEEAEKLLKKPNEGKN